MCILKYELVKIIKRKILVIKKLLVKNYFFNFKSVPIAISFFTIPEIFIGSVSMKSIIKRKEI